MDISTLHTNGYVSFTYPEILRESVAVAMQSWQNFCDLSLSEKRTLSGGDRIKDYGYMLRSDKGPKADSKELFHIRGEQIPELREKALQITDKRGCAFIEAVADLIEKSKPTVRDFAASVEAEYGLTGFTDQVLRTADKWTFRYLHYFGGDILANSHADRGGFTFHLDESHSGGEYLDFSGVWHPWPVNHKQTIIFPSMDLQHRSHGQLKALWHRVSANEETFREGRYAMVLFIDFDHPFRYDDSKKRLQEFPEGFNYQIDWEDFDKLYIPRR